MLQALGHGNILTRSDCGASGADIWCHASLQLSQLGLHLEVNEYKEAGDLDVLLHLYLH